MIYDESSADRLKKLRKSFDLTQEQMAEKLGISVSLYKGIEAGKLEASRRTADAVQHSFGVSADYIYCGTLRDDTELWNKIYECDDEGKMKIMFRLMNYFAVNKKLTQDDDKIERVVKDMFDEE